MFGWFSGGPPKFDQSTVSNQVTLSKEGCRAFHSNEEDLGGVLFLYPQLTFTDSLAYFEVKIEVTRDDEEDGITLGVTTVFPSFASEAEKPGCADDVDSSWSLGYDGRAHIHGANDLLPTSWNPKNLKRGDVVGFLVSEDGAACVLVNQEIVITMPGIIPPGEALYGVVDLLGNCQGVLLNENATPPPAYKGFGLQKVREDVVEEIYNYVAEQNFVQVKAAMILAKQLGVQESLLKAAEKSLKNGSSGSRKSVVRKSKAHPPGDSSQRSRSSMASVQRTDSQTSASSSPGSPGMKGVRASTLNPRASSTSATRRETRTGEDVTSPRPRPSKLNTTKKASVLNKTSSPDTSSMNAAKSEKVETPKTKKNGSKENEAVNANQAEAEKAVDPKVAEAEKAKQEALKTLDGAISSKDLGKIRSALRRSVLQGVSAPEITRGEKAVQDLEADIAKNDTAAAAKNEAIKAMDEALKSQDVAKVKAAIDTAKSKGVDASEISAVEDSLKNLEAKLAKEAKIKEKAQALEDAIASKDASKLKTSIKEAQDVGVDQGSIEKAEAALKKVELSQSLDEALKSDDIGKVKDAIAKAKEGGLDSADIQRGEDGLRKLEVAKDLQDALRSNKLDDIKAAISKAKDAQVSADLIAKAEKQLAEIQRKIDEAKATLQKHIEKAKAVKPPTVEMMAALDAATKEAEAAGVDTQEAKALHQQMIEELAAAKREAEDELNAAVAGKNGEAIGKAAKKCKLFGSTDVVTKALDELSKLITAEIDSVRDVEKSVRMEKMPMIESLVGLLRDNNHPTGKKLHNDVQDIKGALRVFCRVRPLNKRELAMNDQIVVEQQDQFTVSVSKDAKKPGDAVEAFSYDSIFIATNTQEDVFEECKGLIESAFDGYNVTIFTYGQTGAGKTWTLYGIPEQPGVSPRTCHAVFDTADHLKDKFEIQISASMIELYNSNVRDLLANEKPPPQLQIKNEKNKDGSLTVKLDSTEVSCSCQEDLTKAVEKGFGNRKVTATAMNADSSRSHLMFLIFVKVTEKAPTARVRHGKITIVDLAGSERLAKSQVTGDAQKEAIEINKSLTALGDVMMAVSKKEKMVPYRNHKLTQLMQDSLGGTAKTLMFVNISPASNNADETINALKYASRARSIENEGGGPEGAKKKPSKAKAGGSKKPSVNPS